MLTSRKAKIVRSLALVLLLVALAAGCGASRTPTTTLTDSNSSQQAVPRKQAKHGGSSSAPHPKAGKSHPKHSKSRSAN